MWQFLWLAHIDASVYNKQSLLQFEQRSSLRRSSESIR